MSESEYAAWVESNQRIAWNRAASPCDDCIVSFALEMRAQDRCDGTPGGWEDDEDPTSIERAREAAVAAVRARRASRIAEADRLRRSGLSLREVAAAMGTSRQVVWRYLRDAA